MELTMFDRMALPIPMTGMKPRHVFPASICSASRLRWLAVPIALLLLAWAPAFAQQQSCPKRTDYLSVHIYDARCSVYRDVWGTIGSDHVLTSNAWGTPISVTSAMTLAGAIASVKVAGYEYIASGGHGAAFQWAFHHDAANSPYLNECNNPTQAGTRSDGTGRAIYQYHGPSTSAVLSRPAATLSRSVTTSRMAMWLKNGEISEFDSPLPAPPGYKCVASYPSGSAELNFGLSDYWLENTLQMAPGPYFSDRPNVFSVSARLSTTDASRLFDGFLVAYLRSEFTQLYNYDPVSKRLSPYAEQASAHPVAACNATGYCMALYFSPTDFQTGSGSPASEPLYYYASRQHPGSGDYDETTLIQVSIKPATITNQNAVQHTVYTVLGNKPMIEDSLCIMRERDRLRTAQVSVCNR
jgi:hypothetical protein